MMNVPQLQLKFHAQRPAAAASSVEQCRKDMHLFVIASAIGFIIYFSAVLGGARHWSVVILCGAHMPSCCSATFAVRMWIST